MRKGGIPDVSDKMPVTYTSINPSKALTTTTNTNLTEVLNPFFVWSKWGRGCAYVAVILGMDSNHSSGFTVSTGAPQGCVLSPMLYTLHTQDSAPIHNGNFFVRFADMVLKLIYNNSETAPWCFVTNLAINSSETKKLVLDLKKKRENLSPSFSSMGKVSDSRFLGTCTSQDFTRGSNTIALLKNRQPHHWSF